MILFPSLAEFAGRMRANNAAAADAALMRIYSSDIIFPISLFRAISRKLLSNDASI